MGHRIAIDSQLTSRAIAYSWRQLAIRAGVPNADLQVPDLRFLDIPVYYTRPEHAVAESPAIFIIPCSGLALAAVLERAATSINWISADQAAPQGASLPFAGHLPVLFWSQGCEHGQHPFASLRADGSLVLHVDIIATAFFMLSRWEETVVAARDLHGRFPGTASVAHRQGFLDRPIVDEYALILREWLKVLVPAWEPQPLQFSVKLSHDVDSIRRFASPLSSLRISIGDVAKRHSFSRARQTLLQASSARRDPYLQGIGTLARLSKEHGLGDDAFYFMATKPDPKESDYDLNQPLVRECIDTLRSEGFEIGLHPGYRTFGNPDLLAAERARLAAVLGEGSFGGRQHFLRFQIPVSWRHWEQAGMTYDSTMAYADQEGFRCGTCHAYRPFDLELDRELDLWEVPLIVMDGTLVDYKAMTPSQGGTRILELAERCRAVGGTFTLLWHNSSLSGSWSTWRETYETVVRRLASL